MPNEVAEIYVYDKPGFGGSSRQFTKDEPDLTKIEHKLGNWNDEIESIDVLRGIWEFYEDVNFGGRKVSVAGPRRGNCEELGIPANWISSVKKIRD